MTLRPSSKRMARGPMKKVNRARRSKEFTRCYLSQARVQFVQRLHCIVDGCESTASENAHVCDDGSKGGSRKSGYRCIAPLCHEHHAELDSALGSEKFSEKYGVSLEDEAAKTERLWQRVGSDAEFPDDEYTDEDAA